MLVLDLIILIKKYRYRSCFNIIINYSTNKKPHKNVGLDVVKRVELFQKYHLPYLPELASLDHKDIHASG